MRDDDDDDDDDVIRVRESKFGLKILFCYIIYKYKRCYRIVYVRFCFINECKKLRVRSLNNRTSYFKKVKIFRAEFYK